MSLIQLHFHSRALNASVPVNIVLPQTDNTHMSEEKLPVLYLLHGMGDDASAWLRKTDAESCALTHGLALVMPDGGLSCYENMAQGGRYRDYICEELPEMLRQNFPLSTDRAQNFIAGCSMGGFGALKLALAHPEKWSAIGCFSAAHFEYRTASARHQALLRRVYGEDLDAFDARIVQSAHAANAGAEKISIYHCCGDQDFLLENALKTRTFFEDMPAGSIDYRFEILPGRHDWTLWNEAAHRFFAALHISKPEVPLF